MKHGCEEPPRGCQKRLIDRSSWHQGYIEVLETGTVKRRENQLQRKWPPPVSPGNPRPKAKHWPRRVIHAQPLVPRNHVNLANKILPGSPSRNIGHECSRARALCKSAKAFLSGFRQFSTIDHRRIRLLLPPLPQRHRLRVGPQSFPRLSCFLLQPIQHRIPLGYFRYHQHQPSSTSV